MTAPAAAIQLDRVYAGINHYNAKENRCFMELWYSTVGNDLGNRTVSDVSVHALEDAFDRKTVAMWADNGCEIDGENADCARVQKFIDETFSERRAAVGRAELSGLRRRSTIIRIADGRRVSMSCRISSTHSGRIAERNIARTVKRNAARNAVRREVIAGRIQQHEFPICR